MPVVKAMDWIAGVKLERKAGPDLVPDLFSDAEKASITVSFYGSTDDVLRTMLKRLALEHPRLKIGCAISPPFRKLTSAEEEEYIKQLNDSGTGLLFVALGCPKQEKWMSAMKGRIRAIMIGVGNAFPIYAGMEPRAPLWMQRNALEWVYRFSLEPRRLWKRYFFTNSRFAFMVVSELFSSRRANRSL
jgi:N-acetylglucosaminyldiphosphoundecaprenol N-acetyl-beta-D-mannosaminyltransferase